MKVFEESEVSRLGHEELMVLVQRGRAECRRCIAEQLTRFFAWVRRSVRELFDHRAPDLRLRQH